MQIQIESLTKVYPGAVTALDDVSLTIPIGMYGLLGPNGAGKTTLMRILATLLEPTRGKISIGEVDRLRHPQQIRQMIGYLPQEFGLYRRLTAPEYLDFVGGMKGVPARERKAQISDLLERVHLAEQWRKPLGSYSGGMKRRLGIAQALLGSPQVLIVDEPTAGLDPEERLRFRNLLAELSASRVVLLSTHIVADIESACTQLAVITRGRVRFTGSPAELIRQARGKVWELSLTDAEYNRMKNALAIVSSRRTDGGMQLRLLAPENPLGQARTVEPTMEDGYLSLMGEVPA